MKKYESPYAEIKTLGIDILTASAPEGTGTTITDGDDVIWESEN